MSLLLLFSGSATQPSGGWRPRLPRRREETEAEREARILEERIRLGIIVPAPPLPTETHREPDPSGASELRRLVRLQAQADAIAEAGRAIDVAGLRAAARLDEEVAQHLLALQIIDARRRQRLREDDEILLLLH